MVTINRAIDHLIDVLAGEDVPVVGSKATRVDQLADMIADGEIVIGGGGDSAVFVVNFTDDGGFEPVFSADKTLAEVQAAVEAGKLVIGLTDGAPYPLIQVDETYVLFGISNFQGPAGVEDTLLYATFSLTADAVTYAEVEYDLSSLVAE